MVMKEKIGRNVLKNRPKNLKTILEITINGNKIKITKSRIYVGRKYIEKGSILDKILQALYPNKILTREELVDIGWRSTGTGYSYAMQGLHERLKRLDKMGIINFVKRGRRKDVKLTPLGKVVAEILIFGGS